MKKKLWICLAVMMMMSLMSACGDDKADNKDSGRVSVADLNVEKYITLGEYKNIAVTVSPKTEVTDEMVATYAYSAYINLVTKENGGITDRAVEEGDVVNFDYAGTMDGEAFDGGTAEGTELEIGSGQFIPGFEEGMIGMKPGETKDLNLTFPDNYYEDKAGKAVVFTVTVNYILPTELQDDVVAGFGNENFANVEEFNQAVKETLERQIQSNYDNNVSAAILEQVIANSTFAELPQDLVDQYAEQITATLQTTVASYGMDVDSYCQYVYGMAFTDYVTEAADVTVKQVLVIQRIAEIENLILTDKQLDERIAEIVADNGWSSEEELLENYAKDVIKDSLLFQNVTAFLAENAVITNE